MRRVIGIVVGLAIVAASGLGAEWVATQFVPLPYGLERNEALILWMASTPRRMKLLIAAIWFVGSLAGTWLSLRIGQWLAGGGIVLLGAVAFAAANLLLVAHPWYLQIAAVAAPLIGGIAAGLIPWKIVRRAPRRAAA
jgi:hypothetical protein